MKKLKPRSRSNSKTRNKTNTHISASLVPKIAFVANPTAPIKRQSIEESRKDIFKAALRSSLLSLSNENINQTNNSQESIQDNNYVKGKTKKVKKSKKSDVNDIIRPKKMSIDNSAAGTINIETFDRDEVDYHQESEFGSNTNRIEFPSHKWDGELRNGDSFDSLPSGGEKKVAFEFSNRHGTSEYNNTTSDLQLHNNKIINSRNNISMPIEKHHMNYNPSDLQISTTSPSYPDQQYNSPYPDQQQSPDPYPEIEQINLLYPDPPYPDGPTVVPILSGAGDINQRNFPSTSNNTNSIHRQSSSECPPPPINFANTPQSPSIDNQPHKLNEVRDVSPNQRIQQQREEITLLRDTVYRLNLELSNVQIGGNQNGVSGNFIGNSLLPGKGPVPPWLMNSRYLAPLMAAHDRKFKQQDDIINRLKSDIIKFENDIKKVLNENERLHLKVQENANGRSSTNHSEWEVISTQARLVIEENRLLLEELDIHQQKAQSEEKRHQIQMADMKKVLMSVTTGRDALEEEIRNLTRRLTEARNSNMLSPKPTNSQQYSQQYSEEFLSSKHKFYESQLEEMRVDKQKLERDLIDAKEQAKILSEQLGQQKQDMKSENELKYYLGQVIDKSNLLAEERGELTNKVSKMEKEIKKNVSKVVSEIKYRTHLELYEETKNDTKHSISSESFYHLEQWIELLLDSFDDLSKRCRHQERDVFYYQNLLKEKDKFLQECSDENRELEQRLLYLVKKSENSD